MESSVVFTIDPVDLDVYHETWNTSKHGFVYYEVVYYDMKEKYKSAIIAKIKIGEDVLTIIRCYIALEHLKWKHKLRYPSIYHKEDVKKYIGVVKEKLNITDEIVDLFSIAERAIDPNTFYQRFEFDFREVNYCHGCRKGLKGLKAHKDGCF